MAVSGNKRSVMTLFSNASDIYSHQVRIVLAEKGVTYDVLNVEGEARALREELASYNPYGTLPTLVDRDLVLYQSDIIMEYLDERFPHPPLMPIYPVARGRSRLMMHRIREDWYKPMHHILEAQTDAEKKQAQQDLLNSMLSVVPVFNEMPFFLSDEFSIVDCCITALLWRLPLLGIEIPPQGKPIMDYAKRMFERESFQISLTDFERTMRML